jgi:DNA invertase Pin-like site-specific DNA recombinase
LGTEAVHRIGFQPEGKSLMSVISAESAGLECAVIYTRVSSTAQTKRGDGLRSQETRCREFARMKGYFVAQVFSDDLSGSLIDRPGMQGMLTWLKRNRSARPVVVIDDISRLARGLEAHLQLRSAISVAGGRLESPSVEFGEDSDSILVENLLASVSQHQRQKNAEQVKNRMRARMMNGYWVFHAPSGYRYGTAPGHGKLLVRNEPFASIIQESLQGFASGRFTSLAEVKRFLESHPVYPRDARTGEVHQQRVVEILNNPVYAGLIGCAKWGVPARRGHHEPLIDLQTYQRNQERLQERAYTMTRKDTRADFPLRGTVCCAGCGGMLSAGWSSGRARKYPYYLCFDKKCDAYRKSIARDRIEEEFARLLARVQPAPGLVEKMRQFFVAEWAQRSAHGEAARTALKDALARIDRDIASFLDRLVGASSETVARAFERKIGALEKERHLTEEKLNNAGKPRFTFDEVFEHALRFLASPCDLWNSERFSDRRLVLKLVFPKGISYCRNGGFRTTEISTPFKVLGMISARRNEMVGFDDETLNRLFQEMAEWNDVLKHSGISGGIDGGAS